MIIYVIIIMLLKSVFVLSLSVSFALLLDKQNAENTTTKSGSEKQQYATMDKYLKLEGQQQQTQSLLKSLQNKLSLLQKSWNDNDQVNNTDRRTADYWEMKYHDLEGKYKTLTSELSSVQRKLLELTTKFSSLERLSNIHILQDIQKMKLQVKSIGAKTFILDSNGRARNKDIFELYNKTFELQKSQRDIEIQTIQSLQGIKHDHNDSFSDLKSQMNEMCGSNKTQSDLQNKIEMVDSRATAFSIELENRMKDVEIKQNITEELLRKRAANADAKVALTACTSYDGVRNNGQIIKFDEVRFHVGISNLADVRSSGTFTCEKDGLYHISAVINGPTRNGQFSIHVNGNTLSTLKISSDDTINTGTSVLAAELQVNDIVSVISDSRMQVYIHWSCMTVVKIH